MKTIRIKNLERFPVARVYFSNCSGTYNENYEKIEVLIIPLKCKTSPVRTMSQSLRKYCWSAHISSRISRGISGPGQRSTLAKSGMMGRSLTVSSSLPIGPLYLLGPVVLPSSSSRSFRGKSSPIWRRQSAQKHFLPNLSSK